MKLFWIMGGILLFLTAVVLGICYICYRMAFYVSPKQRKQTESIELPDGKIYEQYHAQIAIHDQRGG